jgi:hypothetical protein
MLAITTDVIAGLADFAKLRRPGEGAPGEALRSRDPPIHHRKTWLRKMDTRVKLAYDQLKKNGRTNDAA